MPDYSKGKIYRIVGSDMTYIGSTCCTLRQRLAEHVSDYNKFKDGKRNYTSSFQIIEKGNYDIILLEDYPCERREQLLMRERHYFEIYDCVNKLKPILYSGEKKERKRKHGILYAEQNKEKIKEYQHTNKERIALVKKIYNEKNKDEIKRKRHIYYETNKIEISKMKSLNCFLKSELKNYNL